MWQYTYSNELVHHGVLGMKWGHRKHSEPPETHDITAKNGDAIQLVRRKSINKKYNRENLDFDIKRNGKNIGSLDIGKKAEGEMNVNWMNINPKYQGRGYTSAILEQGEKIAKENGGKKLTAEIVGTAPDMLHIVESHGFVKTGEVKTKAVLEVWGGYTLVEKPL